jgi:hypothetical protein
MIAVIAECASSASFALPKGETGEQFVAVETHLEVGGSRHDWWLLVIVETHLEVGGFTPFHPRTSRACARLRVPSDSKGPHHRATKKGRVSAAPVNTSQSTRFAAFVRDPRVLNHLHSPLRYSSGLLIPCCVASCSCCLFVTAVRFLTDIPKKNAL